MKRLSLAEKLKMLSDELAEMSYELTFDFPKYEKYALGDQIRRSLLSVPSNIYEGLCQDGDRGKRRYLIIAYGSLSEFRYQIYFASKRKYITGTDYKNIKERADSLSKLLNAFIKKLAASS